MKMRMKTKMMWIEEDKVQTEGVGEVDNILSIIRLIYRRNHRSLYTRSFRLEVKIWMKGNIMQIEEDQVQMKGVGEVENILSIMRLKYRRNHRSLYTRGFRSEVRISERKRQGDRHKEKRTYGVVKEHL